MLKKILDNSKIPAFSEMTKKKIVESELTERQSLRQSIKGSMRESMRGSINRNALDEIDSNADKNDIASTCMNYRT
jgi:hypothetical protein